MDDIMEEAGRKSSVHKGLGKNSNRFDNSLLL